MIKQKPQDSAFTDGIVKIYRKRDAAKPGNMPVERPSYLLLLRYHRRTVGSKRFYDAFKYSQKIDEVIRCPLASVVSADDIAELPGGTYVIRQVQYPEGAAFPMMDLALERTVSGHADH